MSTASYEVLHINHPRHEMAVTHSAELQPDLRSATHADDDYNLVARDFYVQEYFIS
jgi:hypothetical protein